MPVQKQQPLLGLSLSSTTLPFKLSPRTTSQSLFPQQPKILSPDFALSQQQNFSFKLPPTPTCTTVETPQQKSALNTKTQEQMGYVFSSSLPKETGVPYFSPQSLSSTPNVNHALATPWTTPIEAAVVASSVLADTTAPLNITELDTLLAAPMFDDVQDTASWDSLFDPIPGPQASTPLFDSPIDTRFVREKRSAIVMAGDSALASPRPSKHLKAASSEFDRLTSLSTPTSEVKELPPIVVKDPSDPKAVRRARNTAAARRSRDKKREHLQELEDRIAELERINTELSIENQFLKSLRDP